MCKNCEEAWKEYLKFCCDTAWKEYEKVCDTAWKEYKKVRERCLDD